MKMVLHHEVRIFRHPQREAMGEEVRLSADGPATEWNGSAAGAHPAEPWFGPLLGFFVNASVAVSEIKNMMHDCPSRWTHIYRRDPFVFGQAQHNGNIAINGRPVSGHVVGCGHFEDQVRFAQPPSGSELGRFRFFGWVTFRRS